MEFIKTLLEQQPLMALFLTIAIGYLVGEINIKGFSLGVGAVLFVALGMGWFAPKSGPAPMVGTLGLALFLYGVGVQYGKQFFIGLTSPAGLKANAMALTGVLCAGAVSLLFVKLMNLKLGYALGLFAGSARARPRCRRDRDARQRRSRRRLFCLVSLRRRRADPVPLRRLHGAEAKDRRAHRRRHGASRNRRAQSRAIRHIARRADERAALQRADRRAAPRGPQRGGLAQSRPRRKRRPPRRRIHQRSARSKPARSSAKARTGISSQTAPTSTTSASSPRAPRSSAKPSANSSCPARKGPSSCRSAAATPTSSRTPTS
jgi:AspT/YidE/YbjL antiporter-like protein